MKQFCIFILLVFVSHKSVPAMPQNPESNSLKPENTFRSKIRDQQKQTFNSECQEMAGLNKTLFQESKKISVDAGVFEEYLKNIDLKAIPGFLEDKNLTSWVPSKQMQNDLPSFISGFDHQNRPIFVYEYGKQNFDKYATGGKELKAIYERFHRWNTYNNIKAMAFKSTKENPVYQNKVIVDLDGLKPVDVLNPAVLQLQLKFLSDYRRWTEKYTAKVVVINVNPISENLLNFGRYVVLRLLGKFEIYGTNRAFWIPQLLKNFPKNQLPEKYGGCKGFQPFRVV